MRSLSRATLAVVLFSSMACYHAIITTGRAESSTIIEKPWASSFVFGLVPPDPLEVSNECKSGVAKVETQHSFLNALVAFLTFQIYTPMDIKVTCAGPGMAPKTSMLTPSEPTDAARQQIMNDAYEIARRTGQPVFVRF